MIESTFFEDLSECDYFQDDFPDGRLTAVGWLSASHSFPTGPTSREFQMRLFELLVNPWEPGLLLGWQECPFCGFSGDISQDWQSIAVGNANLFVPDNKGVFACPSLIFHYILVHDYRPPDSFVAAVLNCPPMKSPAYFQALALLGLSTDLSQ